MKMNGHDRGDVVVVVPLPPPTREEVKQQTLTSIAELFNNGMTRPALIAEALENTITPQGVTNYLQDMGLWKPEHDVKDTLKGMGEDTLTRLRLTIETRKRARNNR
jgi:hypothetical protein